MDMNEPDRNPGMAGLTPGAAGAPCSGSPLEVTGFNPETGEVTITYGTACSSSNDAIYAGPLTFSDISNYNYTSAACSIGNTGTATFTPTGDIFFVIVADDGTHQGSYGERHVPLPGEPSHRTFTERSPNVSVPSLCGPIQSLANRCD